MRGRCSLPLPLEEKREEREGEALPRIATGLLLRSSLTAATGAAIPSWRMAPAGGSSEELLRHATTLRRRISLRSLQRVDLGVGLTSAPPFLGNRKGG